jgi:hypothetical protein
VSQQLRVLRDAGFATVRPEGTRRLYAVDATPLREVATWIERYRRYWNDGFDSLEQHLAEIQGKPAPFARPARRGDEGCAQALIRNDDPGDARPW